MSEKSISRELIEAYSLVDEIVSLGITRAKKDILEYCKNYDVEEDTDEERIKYARIKKLQSMLEGGLDLNTKEKTTRELEIEKKTREALKKFETPNLLKEIQKELSKTHIGDNNAKMTTFLCGVSGLSPNPKRRMSGSLKGDSSIGKDNVIRTTLKHLPHNTNIFLTSATQSVIEEDINKVRVIAFSEVNANREKGANQYLTEVIKQKTEGGTSSIKKDIRTGMKEARHDTGEQCSVLYATTETNTDEELRTRFIEINLETNYSKIKSVNDKTLDIFSDKEKLLENLEEEDSWIKLGLTRFFYEKKQVEVLIPYAKFLKEQINGEDILDNNSPRSQRDIKRLLGLTCATTYLYQLQRKKINYKGKTILISEPIDFVNTLKYTQEFFNQSYSGLDARLNEVLKHIGKDWIERDYLEKTLDKSKNTIIGYCKKLSDEGMIEGIRGNELNIIEGLEIYHKSKIYYKRCQKHIKKPLIRCQLFELKEFLENKMLKEMNFFDTFDLHINTHKKHIKKKGINLKQRTDTPSQEGKIDTFFLTPFESQKEVVNKNVDLIINEYDHFPNSLRDEIAQLIKVPKLKGRDFYHNG